MAWGCFQVELVQYPLVAWGVSGSSWSGIRLWRGGVSGSNHTSDLKSGTPVATLPGAWRYRVGAGTGWSGVRIL